MATEYDRMTCDCVLLTVDGEPMLLSSSKYDGVSWSEDAPESSAYPNFEAHAPGSDTWRQLLRQ